MVDVPYAPDAHGEKLSFDSLSPCPRDTRVVGLGGSAGSISALQRFFEGMPTQSGMAFLVVLHLAPEYDSALTEILQKATHIPIERARDGRKLLANRVYVIPPAQHLSLSDGYLRLTELKHERAQRMTVDLFFRSLADAYGPHAVAVVLSGLDGDGTLGIKRVKERGGLTIAQEPGEAEHPFMPRAAIATSMVDWILRVEKMPQHLLEHQALERRLRLPPESGPNTGGDGAAAPDEESALRDVLAFLCARTGRDLSCYKRSTLIRRLARRMQVVGIDSLSAYLDHLRLHPGEAGALLQDLLISVTNFFRDREAFDTLEACLPELFRGKTRDDTLRVWVPACATGEEAYSIAILLSEYARALEAPPTLKIFATDLDEAGLTEARNGVYPLTIEADVSPARLERFFIREHRGYRVRPELRELLVFAVHDLLKDWPFSRLDLVSCRNLLIYLNRTAQELAFDIFHFALRAEGRLFLGASEAIDDVSQLFRALDAKHRIYLAQPTRSPRIPVPSGASALARSIALRAVEEGAAPNDKQRAASGPRALLRPFWTEGETGWSSPEPNRRLSEPTLQQLERELEQTKWQLREVVDHQIQSSEELRASNEALYAGNEELRSAAEELETSREELQSLNEELTTVNQELKIKVEELGQANHHLHNLMGATAVATLLLDCELCIVRFTPPAADLFNLIPTDIGRPLAHLRHRLIYPELLAEVRQVLEQLEPREREVGDTRDRFFLARLLPYRGDDARLVGVSLTFVDVTELHLAQHAFRSAQLELEQRVQERTAQLDAVNSALRAQIIMHRQAESARQDLQRRLVNAQEQERSRISRELHDEVGQQITALMLALKALESEVPANTSKLWDIRGIAEQVGQEIHRLAAQLRPMALDELGLSRALSGYLDAWAARTAISVDFFSVGVDEARLPREVETTLYRIVQEAMNNIYKHAAAKSVSVSVERRAGYVLAIVEDDGLGFDPDGLPSGDVSHIGIASMRERSSIVGGVLTIESSPEGGTTVRARLPVPLS